MLLPDVTEIPRIKLTYERNYKHKESLQITYAQKAYKILLSNWNLEQIDFVEEFKILLLNRTNVVIGIYHVSSGGPNSTIISNKLILASALLSNAEGILLCHNHPSGNLKPSSVDIEITKRLVEAGKLLDIMVVDHLIISKEGYTSFRDAGII